MEFPLKVSSFHSLDRGSAEDQQQRKQLMIRKEGVNVEMDRQQQQRQKQQEQAYSIPIIKIVVDESLQIRDKMLPWKIIEYRNKYLNGIEMKPLLVAERGDGYVLIAGFHRLAALKMAGFHRADAVIINAPQREWIWLAIESNLDHGIPLKASEIRKAFRMLIRTKGNVHENGKLMSYEEIAKKIGGAKSRQTIFNWMNEDFPEVAKRMSVKGLMLKKRAMEDGDEEMRDEKIIKDMTQLLEKAVALSRTITTQDGRERFDEELKRVLRDMDDASLNDPDDENLDF